MSKLCTKYENLLYGMAPEYLNVQLLWRWTTRISQGMFLSGSVLLIMVSMYMHVCFINRYCIWYSQIFILIGLLISVFSQWLIDVTFLASQRSSIPLYIFIRYLVQLYFICMQGSLIGDLLFWNTLFHNHTLIL